MNGYDFKLLDFEGSIDLLLHLARKLQLCFEDVTLAKLTDRYLEDLGQVEDMGPEQASSFLKTASILVRFQSIALLPSEPEDPEEPKEQELRERMRIYSIYRSVQDLRRTLEESGSVYFYRGNAMPMAETSARILNVNPVHLLTWPLVKREAVKHSVPVFRVVIEVHSVRRQKERLLRCLVQGPFFFEALYGPLSSRLEIVVTFMKLLDWWAQDVILEEESCLFAVIEVRKACSA